MPPTEARAETGNEVLRTRTFFSVHFLGSRSLLLLCLFAEKRRFKLRYRASAERPCLLSAACRASDSAPPRQRQCRSSDSTAVAPSQEAEA